MSKAQKSRQKYAFLEPAALQELGNLRFAARRIVDGAFAGRHRSKMKGSSVEFADYREYSPGDDLRRLDWKVFMRTQRPFIRTFDEETNMSCHLVLDTSASMDFGKNTPGARKGDRATSLSKLDYCRFLAAALAYLVVDNRDQAGLGLIGEKLDDWREPGSTRRHLDELLNILERAQVAPKTNLAQGLMSLFTMCRRKGVLVLISDFLDNDLDGLFKTLRLFRHRRFEVILFHVAHPEELELPEGRSFRFFDPEGGGEIDADPQQVFLDYQREFEGHCRRIRGMSLAAGCEYNYVETHTPYPDAIRAYLRSREAGQ